MRGIQFHPEVVHTPCGTQVLRNFVLKICGEPGDWTMAGFVETKLKEIRDRVGPDDRVIMGLSGGVDSSVAAALIHRAIGDRLICVFVDNGLLRAGERERMEATFAERLGIPLRIADATDLFLERLAGVIDPEHEAPCHRPHLYRSLRSRGHRDRRRALPGAGHALPRRH